MSLSGALSNALSGLSATSRSAGIVASNIANVATEGYGVRNIAQSSRMGTSGGVRIDGVQREVTLPILAERRLSEAELEQAQSRAEALAQIESLFGTPLEGDSLSALFVTFEIALQDASSRPDSRARLNRVVADANAIAVKFRSISDGLQSIRSDADRSIASQVLQLNNDLERVHVLNKQIMSLQQQDNETAALMDQRQVVIDRISRLVPVQEIARERGAIALMSLDGALLLDGPPARIGFNPVNIVAPQMTQDAGLVSGLTLNGRTISTAPSHSPLRGGGLLANFQIRDDLTVTAQQQIDNLALGLITRFGTLAADPTLAPDQPGLFTDAGHIVSPGTEVGVAGRLSISAAIDPAQGGFAWRIRDGISATVEGPIGNAQQIHRLMDVLAEKRTVLSGSGTAALSFSEQLSQDLSAIGQSRYRTEQSQSFAATRTSALRQAEMKRGVDTDEQLQRLLLIEQTYAANARVIQTIDEMIKNLLRI